MNLLNKIIAPLRKISAWILLKFAALLKNKVLAEASVATLVLAFGGVFVIIGIGMLNGVSINLRQSMGMSYMFIVTRFIGLYSVRYIFNRWFK